MIFSLAGETRGETYLTVQELPEITTQDVITYQKGNNISIECHIVKGNPIPKLIWYKNHYPLKVSSSLLLPLNKLSIMRIGMSNSIACFPSKGFDFNWMAIGTELRVGLKVTNIIMIVFCFLCLLYDLISYFIFLGLKLQKIGE